MKRRGWFVAPLSLGRAAVHRRWREAFLKKMKPANFYGLVHALERVGAPEELNLDTSSWRTDAIQLDFSVVEEPTSILIPEVSGFFEAESFSWPALKLRTLKGVSIDVDSGLIFSGDRVISQSGGGVRWSRDAAFISGGYFRYRSIDSIPESGVVAHLGDMHHYYHFLSETLPRVLHITRLHSDVTFVTSQNPPAYVGQVLHSLDIRFRILARGTLLKADRTLLCDHPFRFWPRLTDLHALRTAFADELSRDAVSDGRIVYVSRSRSSRSLGDEQKLERALKNNGVEVFFLETMPLREQIRVISNARMVISPHGAGLADIAFMNPQTRVLELSSGEGFEQCYRRMAAALQLRYSYFPLVGSAEAPYGVATDLVIDEVLDRIRALDP